MFQYAVVGNPWQPSAALGAPNQAVSGGLCSTSQDPLDSVSELLSGLKDYINSRLSVLESSTKVRVDPVPPSPESQEDEVDREDDEIYIAPGRQEGCSSMKRNLTTLLTLTQ
jgi:hypothetical protein